MALPLRMRLPQKDVHYTLRFGRRSQTPLGRVTILRPGRGASARVLFAISRRVAKKSTARNRLKRRLDEWARPHLYVGGPDIVVHIDPRVNDLTPKELTGLLAGALGKYFHSL